MPLQTPELALTLTETLPAAVGVRFAGVHVRPAVTAVPLQVTVGTGVIAVPTVPVVAAILQANVGGETVTLPHWATLPLQTPELALTLTETLPSAVGVRFAGVQVRPAVTAVPLQVAAGAGEIATPTVPVVAVMAQAKVGTELLLGTMAMLEELGGADELNGATELLLGAMATLEELSVTDELNGATELLLGTIVMLDELNGATELLLGAMATLDELLPTQD